MKKRSDEGEQHSIFFSVLIEKMEEEGVKG
jgi:hypothetical protein